MVIGDYNVCISSLLDRNDKLRWTICSLYRHDTIELIAEWAYLRQNWGFQSSTGTEGVEKISSESGIARHICLFRVEQSLATIPSGETHDKKVTSTMAIVPDLAFHRWAAVVEMPLGCTVLLHRPFIIPFRVPLNRTHNYYSFRLFW